MKNSVSLLILFIIFTTSCNNPNREKNEFKNIVTLERNKIDSLQKIIDTLRTKFIFDNLTILHIPNKNQPIEEGKEYTGKIYFVAFNREDRIIFSDKLDFENADTISKIDYGGFQYKTIGKKGENNFYFKAIINDSISSESQTGLFDGIQMSDKIISK